VQPKPKPKPKPSKAVTVSTFPALGCGSKKIGSELQEIQECAAVPAIGTQAVFTSSCHFLAAQALWR
jgi:hypothetical protein